MSMVLAGAVIVLASIAVGHLIAAQAQRRTDPEVSFSTSVPGGFESCSCELLRRTDAEYPDLESYDTVRIIGPDEHEALVAAVTAAVNGRIGGRVGLGFQTPRD